MAKIRTKRKNHMLRKTVISFCIIFIGYLVLNLVLDSKLSSLDMQTQDQNDKITQLYAKIDGLNTEKQEKISFENIVKVANKKGYTLNYSSDKVTAEANN